jgi:hypothetical protein
MSEKVDDFFEGYEGRNRRETCVIHRFHFVILQNIAQKSGQAT